MEVLKDKDWWKSMTVWGSVAWAVVAVLEALSVLNPELAVAAKGLSAALLAVGIRRAVVS